MITTFLYLQHLFEVRIDDIQHIVSDSIRSPKSYTNVKAYAAKEKPADALIRNPFFDPNPDGTITVEEIKPDVDKIIQELPKWGPSYEISFELKVNKFDGQIIHLTNEQNPGDGVPTVVAADNRLEIYTDINGVDDKKFITREIKARKWYYVVISQKPSAKNPKVVISRFHERV